MQENFNQTPAARGPDALPAALQCAQNDTPIMMYCTGGIRCDIYSAHLRRQGFTNLYTLEGGVHNYLRYQARQQESSDPNGNKVEGSHVEGYDLWRGSLFVFDGRLAVLPGSQLCQPVT